MKWWKSLTVKWRVLTYQYFRKWKLVDSSKYYIIPHTDTVFTLSTEQYNRAYNLHAKRYIFIPGSIGTCVHIGLKDGSELDITDYDTW